MSDKPCKRFWEGAVGVTLTPRQHRGEEYFWTFEFVRAYKRKVSEKWEYARSYSQNQIEALGRVMSQAFNFMNQIEPKGFVENWEAAQAAANQDETDQADTPELDSVDMPKVAGI